MKRLLVLIIAMILVLMTAGSAGAHGGVGFRVFIGLPLFFPFSYPAGYYNYPPPYSYYQPEVRRHEDPNFTGTVVENIYVNGRLVERRVKIHGNGNGNGYERDRRY